MSTLSDRITDLRRRVATMERQIISLLHSEYTLPIHAAIELVGPCGAAETEARRMRQWLGHALGYVGKTSPYREGLGRRLAGTDTRIPPQHLDTEDDPKYPQDGPLVQRIEYLRERLDDTVRSLEFLWESSAVTHPMFFEDLGAARTHGVQARMELGELLGRILETGLEETFSLPPRESAFSAEDCAAIIARNQVEEPNPKPCAPMRFGS
jgi:hypothetical protein